MKKNIILWQSIGFILVSILGVILHFLYDWIRSNFTAIFSATNESTWEHMKLIFFPLFFFAILEFLFVGKEYKHFWCIKLYGTLIGLALIPTIFYTLNGIFGTTPDWVNIATFFISLATAFIYETKELQKEYISCRLDTAAFFILLIIAVFFAIFTFNPPQIPLFEDPISNTYGI